jgi:Amt family ammonium transporter
MRKGSKEKIMGSILKQRFQFSQIYTLLVLLLVAGQAGADQLDSGDTAWMITATALVVSMTIPGLMLFYAGMVRSKNVLSVIMQCFAIAGLVTVLWVVCVYSLSFSGSGSWLGNLDAVMLAGIDMDTMHGTIPESVFMTFQMSFAIITPSIMVGAFAERMKFSANLYFTGFWMILVYAPICHWVWGGGWLEHIGVLDFAGGTVVHINAGVAGLVAAIVLGKREGYMKEPMPANNLTYTLIGAGMLWVGWFGFNAGSAFGANNVAGMAMATTQISTAAAALAWMFAEWIWHGKPSPIGIASGAVAGLVGVTPAAGFIGPFGALVIGITTGLGCYFASTKIKHLFGYDDTLDVFGIHGVGGIIGALLTGVFAAQILGGSEAIDSISNQVWIQFIGVIVSISYTAIVSYIILKIIDKAIGLRVSIEDEIEGLDVSLHNSRGYDIRS